MQDKRIETASKRVAQKDPHSANKTLSRNHKNLRVPSGSIGVVTSLERESHNSQGSPNLGGQLEHPYCQASTRKHPDARIEGQGEFIKVNLFSQLPKRNKEIFGEKLFELMMKGQSNEQRI